MVLLDLNSSSVPSSGSAAEVQHCIDSVNTQKPQRLPMMHQSTPHYVQYTVEFTQMKTQQCTSKQGVSFESIRYVLIMIVMDACTSAVYNLLLSLSTGCKSVSLKLRI